MYTREKLIFSFFSGYLQNTSLRLVPDVSSHPCNTFSMYQRGVSHRVSVKAQRVFSQDFEHPKRSSIVFRVLVPSKDPLFTKETHISESKFFFIFRVISTSKVHNQLKQMYFRGSLPIHIKPWNGFLHLIINSNFDFNSISRQRQSICI